MKSASPNQNGGHSILTKVQNKNLYSFSYLFYLGQIIICVSKENWKTYSSVLTPSVVDYNLHEGKDLVYFVH